LREGKKDREEERGTNRNRKGQSGGETDREEKNGTERMTKEQIG